MFSIVAVYNVTGLAFMEEELTAAFEAETICCSVTPIEASPGNPL
jgi:hypothetical protein